MAENLDPKKSREFREDMKAAELAARDLARDLGYVLESLKESTNLLDKQSKSYSNLAKSSKLLNYVGEQNVQVAKDLTALYDEEVQANSNLILKQNMLATGLKGNYAQLLTTYMVENDITDLNSGRVQLLLKELLHRQHVNEQNEKQLELTEDLAKWQLELNEELEKYEMGWEKTKSKIKAIVTDPKIAKAVFLTSMAEKSHEVYENFEKLGQSGLTVGQRVDYMTKGFSLMSAIGLSDTKGVLDGMVETMGTMNSLTSAEVDHVGHLAKEMGVTGQEAFGLVEGFSKLPGETMATATHAADYVKSLSKANGVAPGKITKEIAKNTELIALGGYKGAKAFTDAAMKAQKMGVELQTTAKVMSGLLNFENSLNKQMEASVLLGKEINLDKARQLALEGKSVEATEEVLKNIGGQAAFDKMNVLQKQALAEATGMTVEELNKAVDAQVEYNKYHGEDVASWKKGLGYAMEYGGAVGGFLNQNGMAILASIQLAQTLNLKRGIGFLAEKAHFAWTKVASLWRTQDEAKQLSFAARREMVLKRQQALEKMNAGGGMMSGMKSAGASVGPMLAFGAAMLMVGYGVKLAAEGLASFVSAFKGLTPEEANAATTAIIGFGIALTAIAVTMGLLAYSGVGEVAIGLLLGFGLAFMMIGEGVALAANGIANLIDSIANGEVVKNLYGVGNGLYYIASGLGALTLASLSATPAVAVVKTLAATGANININKNEGGEENSQLGLILKELQDMNRGLATQPVIVNIDGSKVGEAVRLRLKPSFGTKQA